MTDSKSTTPVAFKIALFNLSIGILLLLITALFPFENAGIGELSFGLILLGLGEYINNPQYIAINAPDEASSRTKYFSRRRNVSSIGNLLDIAGVLMLCIGSASLFFTQ